MFFFAVLISAYLPTRLSLVVRWTLNLGNLLPISGSREQKKKGNCQEGNGSGSAEVWEDIREVAMERSQRQFEELEQQEHEFLLRRVKHSATGCNNTKLAG